MSDPTPEPDNQSEHRRREQSWENWIDEIIHAAQERGEFDNLSGAGKPLPDRRNPYLPEEQQLAYDLIQDSGHTLPWIDDGLEIDRRIEVARRRLRTQHRAWHQRLAQAAGTDREVAAADAFWQHAQDDFAEEVRVINRLIDTYNLKAPLPQLHRLRLIVAEEIQRLDG